MACYLYKKTENGDIVKEECFAQDVASMLNHGYKSLPEDFLAPEDSEDSEDSEDTKTKKSNKIGKSKK